MPTPLDILVRKMVDAEKLRAGTTIIERTERGRIHTRAKVVETGRCATDAGNMHAVVSVERNGKREAGTHVWCYLRAGKVEVA